MLRASRPAGALRTAFLRSTAHRASRSCSTLARRESPAPLEYDVAARAAVLNVALSPPELRGLVEYADRNHGNGDGVITREECELLERRI
jgi:hypothetical protein